MTEKEITKIISAGESETLEFKTSFDRQTIESCGALANSHGGRIFIGVSGDGTIVGVQIGDETFNDWRNQFAQTNNPTIIPEIESFEINTLCHRNYTLPSKTEVRILDDSLTISKPSMGKRHRTNAGGVFQSGFARTQIRGVSGRV
jgi:predicted HTH transcriptional regulator